jgi:hypothetical protein
MGDQCVVCRRREPASGHVCTEDRNRINTWLDDLPRKMALLPLMLVPGQSPPGEKVTQSRVGSPVPTNLDVLSLVGPGALPVQVRRWSVSRQVRVEIRAGAYTHTTNRQVTQWFQELVRDPDTGQPVKVTDDDQAGVLPPAEWLDQWVRRWRLAFGHKVPARTVKVHRVQLTAREYQRAVEQFLSRHPHARRVTVDDPLADEWETRRDAHPPAQAPTWDVAYLRTWLDEACERGDIDLASFTAELLSLSAELTRVLGEWPDQQWLGRCPAVITDRADDSRATCGAGLWQDPHASVVECPRCHSAWGPQRVQLVHLAAEIRRAWPLDRRRRYHVEEIDALRPIGCAACTQPVRITWQEVTATGDDRRWWRPVSTRCPNTCPEGTTVL